MAISSPEADAADRGRGGEKLPAPGAALGEPRPGAVERAAAGAGGALAVLADPDVLEVGVEAEGDRRGGGGEDEDAGGKCRRGDQTGEHRKQREGREPEEAEGPRAARAAQEKRGEGAESEPREERGGGGQELALGAWAGDPAGWGRVGEHVPKTRGRAGFVPVLDFQAPGSKT